MKSDIAALLAAIVLLTACNRTEIRHETYANGVRKSQAAFLIRDDGSMIRHGVQATWYPDGRKESMKIYVNGYRQGYAFRWHPNGRMKSLESFSDGMREGQAKYWDGDGRLVGCFTSDAADCLRLSAEPADPSMLAVRP